MDTDLVQKHIRDFIGHMGFGDFLDSIEMHQGIAKRFCLKIRGEANMLIGEKGNNLVAMEHLIKKMVKKESTEEENFSLDINDYRVKKLEDLKQDVKSAAHEVRLHKKPVPLRPASSFERRIIHMLLAEYPDITTESVGEEPERRVVIKPYP